jgi:hypothetical protein
MYMNAKAKMPKISDKAVSEIANAARSAYSNSEADKFFEEVIDAARHYEKVFAEEQTRSE